MKKLNFYKVWYRQRGASDMLSYVWLRAKNMKDAKEDARFVVNQEMERKKRGAVQINRFMKSLVFVPERVYKKY